MRGAGLSEARRLATIARMSSRRSTRPPRPTAAPAPSVPPPRLSLIPRDRRDAFDVALLAVVVLAWWGGTARLALHQDDFLLAGAWHGPWRIVVVAMFHALWAAAGATAWPYHAVVLALHLTVAWMVTRVARRYGAGRVPAVVAAAAFAAGATHAYSLYNVASAADIAAALAALVSLWLVLDGRIAAAVGCFVVALACKETVAALPLAMLLLPGRRRAAWTMLGVSVAWLALLRLTGAWVTQQFAHLYISASPTEALGQFLGYVSATADWFGTRVDAYRNVASPSPWFIAAAVAAWASCAARPAVRPLAWFAAAWFVCGIAPATTTRSMFVLYYLYMPLTGVAILAARALSEPRVPPAIACALGAVCLAGSATTLGRIEDARLPGTDVHAQSSLRHAQIAGHAVGDLAGVPLGDAVAVWMPRRYPRAAWRNHGWYGQNVRSALSDGRALTMVCPRLRAVAFPQVGEPYPGRTVVAMGWDGHVRAITPYAP